MARLHLKELKPGDWIEDRYGTYRVIAPSYKSSIWCVQARDLEGLDIVLIQNDEVWLKNKEEVLEKIRVDVSTLKRGDFITNGDEYFSVYTLPEQIDNVWQVETTGDGEQPKTFKQGDDVWLQIPAWLRRAREQSKAKKLSEQL